jgi:hypothetical protein
LAYLNAFCAFFSGLHESTLTAMAVIIKSDGNLSEDIKSGFTSMVKLQII